MELPSSDLGVRSKCTRPGNGRSSPELQCNDQTARSQMRLAPHQGVRFCSMDFGQVGFEPEQVPTARKPAVYLGFEFRTKTPKSGGPERKGFRRATFGRLCAGPVNRSAPKTPGNLPVSAAAAGAESTARMGTGGGSATGCERSLGGNPRDWSRANDLSYCVVAAR